MREKIMNKRNITLFLVSIMMLFSSGCHPYRVDVIQGNIIDNKTMSQLHLGMSKSEVDSLLGTPVLVDTFDRNTWLYAYTRQINGGKIEKKKLVLKFKKDKLVLWQ